MEVTQVLVAAEHVQKGLASWQWLGGNIQNPARLGWCDYDDQSCSCKLQEMHLSSRGGQGFTELHGVETPNCAWYHQANYSVDVETMTQVRLDLLHYNQQQGRDYTASVQLVYGRPIQCVGKASSGRTPNRPGNDWQEVVIKNEGLTDRNVFKWEGEMVSPKEHARRRDIQDVRSIVLGNYFYENDVLDDAFAQMEHPDFELQPQSARQIPIPHQTIAWARDLGDGFWEVEARVAYTSGGWWTFRFAKVSGQHVTLVSEFVKQNRCDQVATKQEETLVPRASVEAERVIGAISDSLDNLTWELPEEVQARVKDMRFPGSADLHKWLGVVNVLFAKGKTRKDFVNVLLQSPNVDNTLRTALNDDSRLWIPANHDALRKSALDRYRHARENAGVGISSGGTECVVCLNDTHRVLLKPCGHFCLCDTCYDRMQALSNERGQAPKCPLCRAAVVDVCKYPLEDKIWERRRPLEPPPEEKIAKRQREEDEDTFCALA